MKAEGRRDRRCTMEEVWTGSLTERGRAAGGVGAQSDPSSSESTRASEAARACAQGTRAPRARRTLAWASSISFARYPPLHISLGGGGRQVGGAPTFPDPIIIERPMHSDVQQGYGKKGFFWEWDIPSPMNAILFRL